MSERELREELARISVAVRRVLEREGLGAELLAQSAARAPQRPPLSPPPAAPRPAPPPPAAAPRPAPPPPAAAASLFGEAARSKAPSGADWFAPVEAPPPAPLHPAGLEARADIHANSLPLLKQIASEVVACTKCGLCQTRTKAVPGVGSAKSGILFVGEAPGAEEDRQGEPFVGRAGELLTKIIGAMQNEKLIPGVPLSRETVYIANVLKCRPPENRNPLPHEIESCSPYLMRQLEALEPRVICCLGKFAAELLLGVKGTIAGMRGKVYRYRGSKLIVTYHPAACLRNPNLKRPVWEDMQLLAREYLAG